MNLKVRIDRLESHQETNEDVIPMTGGFDRFGPTDTIEQWFVARDKINAEYRRLKGQNESSFLP